VWRGAALSRDAIFSLHGMRVPVDVCVDLAAAYRKHTSAQFEQSLLLVSLSAEISSECASCVWEL
jgi:hypothetical protein